MSNIAGMHDYEALDIAPEDTWILDTIALSENPVGVHYTRNHHWIVRANWGYGSTGTLPLPNQYGEMARRLATYVENSSGCHRWQIGNEPSLAREWPDNQPIFPWLYAQCYKLCRDAIHALPGHERDEVLIAGSGPWNNELKYPGNPNGDWIKYVEDVIDECHDQMDGWILHAYVHGYSPSLVTSTAKMDAPFQNRHYEFRTYRDYMEAIPSHLKHLPVYIGEANGNGPWQAVGLMPEMLREINDWNQSGKQLIKSVIFYRYPKYDEYFIEGREDVIREYKEAVQKGYQVPETYLPSVETEPVTPQKGYVTAELLNVRSGPGTGYPKVGSRAKGDAVTVYEKKLDGETSWYKIAESEWVSAQWVSIGDAPPVITPEPIESPPDALNLKWLFNAWCRVLGINEIVAKAILAIESGGNSFENGRMVIRFENHIFLNKIRELAPQLEGRFHEHFKFGSPSHTGHEYRVNPDLGAWEKQHDGGQIEEWAAFKFASTIHPDAAMQSISMGAGQIMGFNYSTVGYTNVQTMFNDYNNLNLGEYNQLTGFFAFILRTQWLLEAAQGKNWREIARLFNGEGNVPVYAKLLSDKYKELGGT